LVLTEVVLSIQTATTAEKSVHRKLTTSLNSPQRQSCDVQVLVPRKIAVNGDADDFISQGKEGVLKRNIFSRHQTSEFDIYL